MFLTNSVDVKIKQIHDQLNELNHNLIGQLLILTHLQQTFKIIVAKEEIAHNQLLVAGQKPATSIFNSFSEMTWEDY